MSSETGLRTLRLKLNGRPVTATVGAHVTLVEMLRDVFGLYGARESCGQGLCGCCTVMVDGALVTGCLELAAFVDGAEVTTIEHLDAAGTPSTVQQAFIDCGAFQCGFCTPGFVLATEALLARNRDPSDEEIRHHLSGNLCRCGAYPEIVTAVRLAAQRLRESAT